jgi:hypothetical protein
MYKWCVRTAGDDVVELGAGAGAVLVGVPVVAAVVRAATAALAVDIVYCI